MYVYVCEYLLCVGKAQGQKIPFTKGMLVCCKEIKEKCLKRKKIKNVLPILHSEIQNHTTYIIQSMCWLLPIFFTLSFLICF